MIFSFLLKLICVKLQDTANRLLRAMFPIGIMTLDIHFYFEGHANGTNEISDCKT